MSVCPQVVVLIIASDLTEYERRAKEIWRTYMNTDLRITCLFIQFDDTIEAPVHDQPTNTLRFPGTESAIPGLFDKTVKAFQWALKAFPDTLYFFRTNLSSVVLFSRLVEKTKHLPRTRCVVAKKVFDRFPSGCGMLLSRDVVQDICRWAPHTDTSTHLDDVVIGSILNHIGIVEYDGSYHHDLKSLPPDDCYHIRCKLGHVHEGVTEKMRVDREIPYMDSMVQRYYVANKQLIREMMSTSDVTVCSKAMFQADPTIRTYANEVLLVKDWNKVDVRLLNTHLDDIASKKATPEDVMKMFVVSDALPQFCHALLPHLSKARMYDVRTCL